MNRLILVVCFLGIWTASQGQRPNYLFSYLGLKEGLHQETINIVQQDAKGYIWLGAGNVLQRYDGLRFKNFICGSKESGIPAGYIRGLQIDKKNRMWILNGDATIGYINPENFSYHPVRMVVPKGFSAQASAILLDKNDQLIVLYGNKGIISYSDRNRIISAENNPIDIPEGWEPIFFWQDDDLNYWMGSFKGLMKYDHRSKSFSYRGHNEKADPIIDKFRETTSVVFFLKDKKGRAWITSFPPTNMFIKSYDPATGKEIQWQHKILEAIHYMYYDLHGIVETGDGTLWMAGNNIFGKVNYDEETVLNIPSNLPGQFSIRYDDIYLLYEDREKNIWTATNKGLFRFNPSSQLFRQINNRRPNKDSIFTPDVTDILETDKGEILVSTWGNDVFSYNRSFKSIPSAHINLENRSGYAMTWSLIQRKNGEIWQGFQGGTIYVSTGSNNPTKVIQSKVVGGSTVRHLAEDQVGNVWVGTQSGKLIKWNAATDSFTMYLDSKGLVSGLVVDNKNDIWVSTDTDGVYYVDSETGAIINHYTSEGPEGKRLKINGASDIMQFDDSLFVIAAEGLNFLNTKTGRFTYFTVDDGLPTGSITKMIRDDAGYIWMSSTMGILSYHRTKKKLSVYSYLDGIHTYTFSQGAGGRLKDGHIIFGTNHDLIEFDPQKVTVTNYTVPKVEIADFKVGDIHYSVDSILKLGKIKLPYRQNSLTIYLSTLTYQNSYPVYYKMDGQDKEWKQPGEGNIIDLNYLPPGKYVLMIACRTEIGDPGPITSITIDIAPPFYNTWWFYILIILGGASILFWLDRERMKRKEALVNMRSSIAAKLHDDVSMALSNIHVLSEMARFKADKDATKANEFIEQIHTKSGYMMQSMDDMLWSISPENDSMENVILRMRECIEHINIKENRNFEMEVDEHVRHLQFNMQQRMQVFVLFKQIVNELKNAGVDVCNIQMKIVKNELIFKLESDNNFNKVQMDNSLAGYEFSKRLKGINAALEIKSRDSSTMIKCRIDLGA